MSTAKGTPFETACVNVAADEEGWPDATRIPKAGAKDLGDLDVVPGWTIEAKNEKSMSLASYVEEARVEAGNAGNDKFAAVHKRRGKHAREAYLTMPWWVYLRDQREHADLAARIHDLETIVDAYEGALALLGQSIKEGRP